MTMTLGLTTVAAVTMITAGIISGKDELRKTYHNDFRSKLMGYDY